MAGFSSIVTRLLATRRPRSRGVGTAGPTTPTAGGSLGGTTAGGVSGRGLRSLLRRFR